MFKKSIALILALVLCFALAACGKTEAPATNTGTGTGTGTNNTNAPAAPATVADAGDPQYGGVAKIAVTSTIANAGYTPLASNNASIAFTRVAYESLLSYDESGALVPMLAKEYQINPDEPSITFKLQQGVTFTDGEPFNAAAVKTNIEEYQKNNRSEVMNIASMEIINDYEIKMILGTWNSAALDSVGFYVLYMSPKALENVDALSNSTCGTGPFQLTEFTPNVSAKYTKNENYWQEGKPYLDGVEIYTVTEITTMESAFIANEYDLIACDDPELTHNIQTKYADKVSSGEYFNPVNTNGQGIVSSGLIPNSSDPSSPFADARVRRAMTYAIDRQAIVDAFTYGTATAIDQWAQPGMITYNDKITPCEYNPEKARALLAEAGYADGFDTILSVNNNADMYTAIAAMLTDVGIRTTVNMIDGATWFGYMASTWEGITIHAGTISPDLGLYMGRHLGDDATFYVKGIDRPKEALDLLEKIRNAKDDNEKIALELEMQDLIYNGEDGLMIFGTVLYAPVRPVWKHSWLHDDFTSLCFSGYAVSYADTWLSK